MSFFSHIGLSIVDKVTGNALDKLGNAIKDGDIKEFTKLFRGLLEGVEDTLSDITEKFEDVMEAAQNKARREAGKLKRQLVRETRQEMEQVGEEFGGKMIEAMEPRIRNMVAEEVKRQTPRSE